MNTIQWTTKAKPKGTFNDRDARATVVTFALLSYGFFEFQNEQMALEAVKQTDGYRLDKNHTFSVNLMSDVDR